MRSLLARESRAGTWSKVVMPDERDEAIRDLSRAREDAGWGAPAGAIAASSPAAASWSGLPRQEFPGPLRTSDIWPRSSLIILPNRSLSMSIRQAVKDAHERVERPHPGTSRAL